MFKEAKAHFKSMRPTKPELILYFRVHTKKLQPFLRTFQGLPTAVPGKQFHRSKKMHVPNPF